MGPARKHILEKTREVVFSCLMDDRVDYIAWDVEEWAWDPIYIPIIREEFKKNIYWRPITEIEISKHLNELVITAHLESWEDLMGRAGSRGCTYKKQQCSKSSNGIA